jgi:hypothetical protein
MTLANVDLSLGQIEMGKGDWLRARADIASGEKQYAKAELATGDAIAYSLLALCDSALGKLRERDAEAAHVRALRSRFTERQEIVQVDIALAELRGQSGEKDVALSQLRDIAQDSRKRGWPGWALEAELAAVRVLQHFGKDANEGTMRASINANAQKLGFGWVLQRLHKLP